MEPQDIVYVSLMTTVDRSVGMEQMTWTVDRVSELR